MGGSTALHEACCEGELELVRELIRGGADVNATAFEIRSTPLVLASHRGLLPIVEELLEAGADVEGLEEGSRTTALHWAAEGGHAAVAERLLDAGARLDPRDGWFGLEPLGWATVVDYNDCFRDDRPALIEALLARGAALDPFSAIALGRLDELRDPRRRAGWALRERTPLHFAASREDAEAIERLLLFGADPGARDAWGITPRGLFPHSGLGDDFGEAIPHFLVEQDLAGQIAGRSDLETPFVVAPRGCFYCPR